MPNTYKVLAQAVPSSANTLTTLYTVPSATSAVVSCVSIANLATTSITYRVAIRPAGASITNAHYLAYDISLGAGDSTFLTCGFTLAATDVISIQASSTSVAFQAHGVEIT